MATMAPEAVEMFTPGGIGATLSPTSAIFLTTVPANGARMTVLSSRASVERTSASGLGEFGSRLRVVGLRLGQAGLSCRHPAARGVALRPPTRPSRSRAGRRPRPGGGASAEGSPRRTGCGRREASTCSAARSRPGPGRAPGWPRSRRSRAGRSLRPRARGCLPPREVRPGGPGSWRTPRRAAVPPRNRRPSGLAMPACAWARSAGRRTVSTSIADERPARVTGRAGDAQQDGDQADPAPARDRRGGILAGAAPRGSASIRSR